MRPLPEKRTKTRRSNQSPSNLRPPGPRAKARSSAPARFILLLYDIMGALDSRRESSYSNRPVANQTLRQMENPIPGDQPVQRLKAEDIIEGRVLPRIQFFARAGTPELE